MTAPILLFTYNRPAHTRLTVESLAANELSRESDLFVYSDGPRNENDADTVAAVRDYLSKISGFRSVTIVERERNYGLADSIVGGVTSAIEKFGQVIVLEDDLMLAPFFLRYMNDALQLYRNEDKVMHIAGYMPKIDTNDLPETFFLRQSSCWGWATWDRSWKYFSRDNSIFNDFSPEDIYRFNLDGTIDFWFQAISNKKGQMKTWAVYWYAAVFKKQGLCLHPRTSFVNNIGHDGSGDNCGKQEAFATDLAQRPIKNYTDLLTENAIGIERFKEALQDHTKNNTVKISLKRNMSKIKLKLSNLLSSKLR